MTSNCTPSAITPTVDDRARTSRRYGPRSTSSWRGRPRPLCATTISGSNFNAAMPRCCNEKSVVLNSSVAPGAGVREPFGHSFPLFLSVTEDNR
jgi:hypothetical protein